jgi:putative ABC transport system permease protein
VVVLGATVANRLFADQPPLGRLIRVDNVPLTVIGILAPKGQSAGGWDQDDVAYTPISTAKLRIIGSKQLMGRQAVGLILIKTSNGSLIEQNVEDIRNFMRQRHRLREATPDDFTVRDMQVLVSQKNAAARTLTIQLAALASVALLVGGIAVMNIMIVSVTERTREIGLRLAVGARRRDLRNQFLVEALMLCLAGGGFGTLLGIGLAAIFSKIGGWPIVISPAFVILAFGSATAIGLFFGIYPAHKASLLEPVEALRHE